MTRQTTDQTIAAGLRLLKSSAGSGLVELRLEALRELAACVTPLELVAAIAPDAETRKALAQAIATTDRRAEWAEKKAERERLEAELRADPVGKRARVFSAIGPCFTWTGVRKSGRIVRQTAKFYVTIGGGAGAKEQRISKTKVHLAPCVSCGDHPRTQYPRGYEN